MVVIAAFAPSSQGEAALRTAITEVCAASEELVIASHSYPGAEGLPECADKRDVLHALSRVASRMPKKEREYLETLDVQVETSRSREIGEFIVEVAHRHDASLIILALRHAAPIGRLSLGQAVRKVLLLAHCPVLVAKDDDHRAAGRKGFSLRR